jgi:hypothetical protein
MFMSSLPLCLRKCSYVTYSLFADYSTTIDEYSTMSGTREGCYYANISVGVVIVNETNGVSVKSCEDAERKDRCDAK